MSEFVLPPAVVPNEVEWSLIDFSGVHQSPLTGAIRTISRGQRWQVRVQYHNVVDAERAVLAAFMARIRGKANRVWVTDPAYRPRGSFPTGELLVNSTFDGATGWSNYGSTKLKPGNNEMQVISVGTAAQGLSQAVQLDAAMAYCLRSCLVDGAGTSGVWMRNQWNYDTTTFQTGAVDLRGMVRTAGVSDAWAAWNVYPLIMYTGVGAGDVGLCQFASMSRCALVVNPGAASCFNSVLVDAMPADTDGVLLAGDRVEIAGEFKTLTADLHSDDVGSGQLMFEPAMRSPVIIDNAPVVVHQPMMRGILAEDAVTPTRPGLFSDFSFTFMEA